MKRATLAVLHFGFFLIASMGNSQAAWIEREIDNPSGKDFEYILGADSVLDADEFMSDSKSDIVPMRIHIRCEKKLLFLWLVVSDQRKSDYPHGTATVRYKFDEDPIADESWEANEFANTVLPTSVAKSERFLNDLMTSRTLIVDVSIGFRRDGYGVFKDISEGREMLSQRLTTCKE